MQTSALAEKQRRFLQFPQKLPFVSRTLFFFLRIRVLRKKLYSSSLKKNSSKKKSFSEEKDFFFFFERIRGILRKEKTSVKCAQTIC